MSLFRWVRHMACIVDAEYKPINTITIGYSFGFKGMKKKTFEYSDGVYNIIPTAFKVTTALKSHIFFDCEIFIYQIGNPDPLTFRYGQFVPLMDAEVYKARLKNKMVVDLNQIAMGSPDIKSILKWFGLGLVILVVGVFLYNKFFVPPEATASVVSAVVNNTIPPNSQLIGGIPNV